MLLTIYTMAERPSPLHLYQVLRRHFIIALLMNETDGPNYCLHASVKHVISQQTRRDTIIASSANGSTTKHKVNATLRLLKAYYTNSPILCGIHLFNSDKVKNGTDQAQDAQDKRLISYNFQGGTHIIKKKCR